MRRVTPDEARAWVDEAWALEERLYSAVRDDALSLVADPLRRPLLFYLGHTASFFANKLRAAGLISDPIHDDFDPLFASGVDEMPGDEMDHSKIVLPPLRDVRAYRAQVLRKVHDVAARVEPPVDDASPFWALFMGADHQRIHVETSALLVRQLPAEVVTRPEGWTDAPASGEPPPPAFVIIPAGAVRLGKPRVHPSFGWDIEYGERVAEVPAFRVGRTLVSNREFAAFVAAGGYAREELWTPAGRRWRAAAGAVRPRFWLPAGDTFRLRTAFDEIDMPWAWPVEVTWHEARAYSRFRGARLPTELEHLRLRQLGAAANLGLQFGSPTPVDHFPAQRNGVHDAIGNVWQHVEDVCQPLPGYRPHPLYLDYSRTSFEGQHHMMLGGSFLSSGAMASPFARTWFRPHIRQAAGIRLVSV
ncbi:MAG TPA: 5-histidylcysteine sulfoxide synthase [Haliangiales bacterium]|nr:5-histidylcysteine sulfoxide synthase [Haliangiales bacterium]